MKDTNIKKTIALCLFLAVLSFTGCDSFLEEKSLGDATTDVVYSTESGYNALITSCYSLLRDLSIERVLVLEGTDMFTLNLTKTDEVQNDYSVSCLNSENTDISNFWEICYKGIDRCNTAIDRANDVENMDASVLKERYAEAVFLRSLYYFFLVQEFGDIPYHEHEVTSVEDVVRTSEATVYANIIADLESIKEDLPNISEQTSDDTGRASWEAVRYLMSQVYLTRGWDYNGKLGGTSEDFTKAAAYADDVITSRGALTLEPAEIYFKNGDTDGTYNDDNSEVIFAFRWSANEAYNTYLELLAEGESVTSEVGGNDFYTAFWKKSNQYGYNKTNSFYSEADAKHQPTKYCTDILHPEMPGFDKRYSAFFRNVITAEVDEQTGDGGYVHIGDTIEYFPGVEDGEAYANGKVFHKADVLANNPYAYIYTPSMYDAGTEINGAYSWIPLWKYFESYIMKGYYGHRDLFYMRLAGAYLLSAEAHLEAGDAAAAAERYTEVRARAIDLSNSPTGVDPDARTSSNITIDDILDERARELGGEYHRWFDLKRTKTLYERTIKYNLRANKAGNLAADNTDMYYLRPIPQDEIDCSGIEQNPGY